MLDQETKRRIDNCRDILVGKVPDPKSQVEQITIALIYKFMDDMDKESEEWGGEPTFFTDGFEKYAWSKIFNPRLGGYEILDLYGEAIVRMNQNPNIPQLFRDIFKNAYLPYRDPETLKSFLKEINEFKYDHSERLGDAYEYLLSVLSSQGDAGQFRTPRHIIDFIVKVVDPKKNETVLDPACGTAGFLISSYNHILRANTKEKKGDQLTADEKERLMENFVGYDISPDMVRLSLVNMYLHGFANPNIIEYDTLTSEQNWDETADVILANPPFMSPKGGIRPHKRFSIQAKRSEVLFVDYIAEHLDPGGRAGVIVPEGIIFQSQTAYKNLRKMLVENYLWAVVSLPAGMFNPYSGVKTSILLMDKTLAKKTNKILFVKIENDGFDLGAQRRPIDRNDLPKALEYLIRYHKAQMNGMDVVDDSTRREDTDFAHSIKKNKIEESRDWNLSGDRYKITIDILSSKHEWVTIKEISDVFIDGDWVESKDQSNEGIRLIQTGNVGFGEYLDKPNNARFITESKFGELKCTEIFKGDVLVSRLPDPVGRACLVPNLETRMITAVDCTIIRFNKEKMIPRLFVYYTKTSEYYKNIAQYLTGSSRQRISRSNLAKVNIPLPPLDVQKAIVAEIDGYQKIIDGARQVVENYKPTIKIDPEWEMVKLGDVAEIKSGGTPSRKISEYWNGDIPWLGSTVCKDKPIYKSEEFITALGLAKSAARLFKPKTTLIALVGATIGKTGYLTFEASTNQNIAGLFPNEQNKLMPEYLYYASQTLYSKFMSLGSGKFRMANLKFVRSLEIPLPSLSVQQKIVAQIGAEQEMVNANKKLIEIYEQKIKDKIEEVWGE